MLPAKLSFEESVKLRLAYNDCSPDIGELTYTYKSIPFFFYGSERKGMRDSDLLENCKLIGYGLTEETAFSMQFHRKLKQPLVFTDRTNGAQIFGEIYSVPVAELIFLDNLYENGYRHWRSARPVQWFSADQKDVKEKVFFRTFMRMYIADWTAWSYDKEELRLMPSVMHKKDGSRYHVFSNLSERTA